MIERHTFKELIRNVLYMERNIEEVEKVFKCHFDENWMTQIPCRLIHIIAEGFQPTNNINDFQVDTVEELLYHFIYMEDCGNESDHCKSKLVIINEGKEDEQPVSCTNVDELYNVITLYVNDIGNDFTFNYCHCTQEDKDLK